MFGPQGTGFFLLLIALFAGLLVWVALTKFVVFRVLAACLAFLPAMAFGIAAVEPGMFRTDWAGRSMVRAPRTIADYDALFEPIRAARAAATGGRNLHPRSISSWRKFAASADASSTTHPMARRMAVFVAGLKTFSSPR